MLISPATFLLFNNGSEPWQTGPTGDGAFQGSLCGNSGHQIRVETAENDAKSWNNTLSEAIIGSTDRTGGRNRVHLGNIG